ALLPFGRLRPCALALLERRRDRGRADRGRRCRLLRKPPAPDLRARRAHRQAGLALARRRVRAGRGQRPPPAPARGLAAVRGRAEEPPAMKKILLAAGAVVVLVAAGLAAFVLYRNHQGRNIRGSSTEEFVTTQAAPVQPTPTAKIRWPMYRFDPTR